MQWKQITQLSSAKANSSGGAGVLARGRQTVISGNLIYGLFMYFCIYLDIPELESWAVAELHAPALHSAGYLLWGSWAQSWPWPGWALPWGPPGWGLCHWVDPSRHVQGPCFTAREEVLDGNVRASCWSLQAGHVRDVGVPAGSSGAGKHPEGAGGHWEFCSCASTAPCPVLNLLQGCPVSASTPRASPQPCSGPVLPSQPREGLCGRRAEGTAC